MRTKYPLEQLKTELDSYNELINRLLKNPPSVKELEDELDVAQHNCIPIAYGSLLDELERQLESEELRECVRQRKDSFHKTQIVAAERPSISWPEWLVKNLFNFFREVGKHPGLIILLILLIMFPVVGAASNKREEKTAQDVIRPSFSGNDVIDPPHEQMINMAGMELNQQFHQNSCNQCTSFDSTVLEEIVVQKLLGSHFIEAWDDAQSLYDSGITTETVKIGIVVGEFEGKRDELGSRKFSEQWFECAKKLLRSEPSTALGFYARSLSHFSSPGSPVDLSLISNALNDLRLAVRNFGSQQVFLETLKGHQKIIEMAREFAKLVPAREAQQIYQGIIKAHLAEEQDWENLLETCVDLQEFDAGIERCREFTEIYGNTEFSLAYLARIYSTWSYTLKKQVNENKPALRELEASEKFLEIQKKYLDYINHLRTFPGLSRAISHMELGYYYRDLANTKKDFISCYIELVEKAKSFFDKALRLFDKEEFVCRWLDDMKKHRDECVRSIKKYGNIKTQIISLSEDSKRNFEHTVGCPEQNLQLLRYGYKALTEANAASVPLPEGAIVDIDLRDAHDSVKFVFSKQEGRLKIEYAYCKNNQLTIRPLRHGSSELSFEEDSQECRAWFDFIKKTSVTGWITPDGLVITEKPKVSYDTAWSIAEAFSIIGAMLFFNNTAVAAGGAVATFIDGQPKAKQPIPTRFKPRRKPTGPEQPSVDSQIEQLKKRCQEQSQRLDGIEKVLNSFAELDLNSIQNRGAIVFLEKAGRRIKDIKISAEKLKTELQALQSQINEATLNDSQKKLNDSAEILNDWQKFLNEVEEKYNRGNILKL